jgi:nucleoid-associated protein YgaU
MGIFDKLTGKKDKPKADFSNVRSGSSSTAPAPAPAPSAQPSAAKRTYTVVSGDSLSKIAKREYGDAQQWRKIYDANRDQISNPDLIHPGQVLNIPS